MKYYIIAGEPSGDLHASNLIRELKKSDPDARFRFWGGDKMQEQAGSPVKHIRETSFMGFREVLINLPSVWKNIRFCKYDILQYNPDALILVDYPGFNLRIAKYATLKGIKVFYYISPKVWAWNRSRVRTIKKYIPHMLVILPFEADFYKEYGYSVEYVGNPLIDSIKEYPYKDEDFDSFVSRNNLKEKPVISLLPGSRRQEIEKCLPVMLKPAKRYPRFQFVIAGAPSVDPSFYERFTMGHDVNIVFNQTYALLKHSRAAVVVSGTATMETALLGVPQVVCYRAGRLSYFLGRIIIKVPFISLVNLIMQKEVVKELIQDELNEEKLSEELNRIIDNTPERKRMLDDYSELSSLAGEGSPSKKAAKKIFTTISQENHTQDITQK